MARSRLQTLINYLRPHWRSEVAGITALLIVNGLGVYIPLLIRNSIDELQVSFDFQLVLKYVVIILVLTSVMWGIRVASRMWLFGVGRQVEFDLKQNIFQHLLTLEPAYFSAKPVGDLINRATSDVDSIRRLVGFALLSLANTVFAYGLTLPVMLSINVRLSLLAISVYPVLLIIVQLFSDRLRTQQQTVQEELSNLSDLIQEDMSGISLIKIYAQEENERRAFAEKNERLLQANLGLAKTRSILFPMLGGLASLSLLVLMAFGGNAIAKGVITVGDFVALLLYVERLVFPTALMGFTITTYQRGEVSIDRVEAILEAKPKIVDPVNEISLPPEEVKGKLTARHLTYYYPDSKTPALNRVNFEIMPGETIAIVGPIAAGKSTLANALPRLLDIEPGQLFLDGQDITQLKLTDLRGAISYVPQESFLFVPRFNLISAYGNPLADQSQVESAAKQAQIHPEILNFPQQYQTVVGERGITLSGGQRQRTALARALLMDSPVLILDDALSSVDNQTATDILKNLSTGTQRKTVIFISHQMSAAAKADRILVLSSGAIIQSGTHKELMAEGGLYRVLWEQQKLEAVLA
jgi:ATP-binding cassette subfamily B multidrug efflux pump